MFMAAAAGNPPPAISRLSSTFPNQSQSSLQTHPQNLKTAVVDTRAHLSNLDRILQKPAFPSDDNSDHPSDATISTTTTTITTAGKFFSALNVSNLFPSLSSDENSDHPSGATTSTTTAGKFFSALNISNLFPSLRAADDKKSPRSLARLHRLLSGSPRFSPRTSIAGRWRRLHGATDWAGLLDPLDDHLRRELVRYGDLVQSAYTAFHSNPAGGGHIAVADRNYRVTRSLFATSSIDLPPWLHASIPNWMTRPTSWIGFVAVCDNAREIARMGRRDIVISLRGTATALEWAENFRPALHPIASEGAAAVSSGFWSLYKTGKPDSPSLSLTVVNEVRRLMEKYKGEELSITVTGHSLGAALAQLVADELADEIEAVPPIAVISFGGPRVGNRAFAEGLEKKGVKVLRIVNAHDMVPKVPGVLPHVLREGYVHAGVELKVDNRTSPYLRPDADPACCHDLEAYLHLVDGFMGPGCPFRADAKRSLTRLLSQQRPNLKDVYVRRAREAGLEAVGPGSRAGGVHQGCLPSPSG